MDVVETSEVRMQVSEFLAEDEYVTIVPVLDVLDEVALCHGEYGPFKRAVPIEVPIWMALFLKRASVCKLVPPRWMEVKELTKLIEEERLSKHELTALPYYFAEIASILLQHAADDIKHPASVRRGIEDLTNLRSAKLSRFMQKQIRSSMLAVKLKNSCSIELNNVRNVLGEILKSLHNLESQPAAQVEKPLSGIQSSSLNNSSTRPARSLRRYQ